MGGAIFVIFTASAFNIASASPKAYVHPEYAKSAHTSRDDLPSHNRACWTAGSGSHCPQPGSLYETSAIEGEGVCDAGAPFMEGY